MPNLRKGMTALDRIAQQIKNDPALLRRADIPKGSPIPEYKKLSDTEAKMRRLIDSGDNEGFDRFVGSGEWDEGYMGAVNNWADFNRAVNENHLDSDPGTIEMMQTWIDDRSPRGVSRELLHKIPYLQALEGAKKARK